MCKRILLPLSGLAFLCASSWFSYWLLSRSMIDGGDFVSLTITAVAAAFVIAFLSDLSEISLGGNVIKLREAKREVEFSISQLQTLLEATFEPQLDAVKVLSGGFFSDAYATKDSRIDRFSRLIDSIKKAGLTEALKPKIVENAALFAKEQLRIIERLSGDDGRYRDVTDLPPPSEVAGNVFSTEPVSSVALRCKLSVDEMRRKVEEALEAYRDMYKISRL